MKHFIKKISIALIIVLLLQISLFGQTSMIKPVEAAQSGPVKVGVSPAGDSIGVKIKSPISIIFDEAINKGTGSETITIYKESPNVVFESFPINSPNVVISGNTVTVTPSMAFENNTNYYVLIESGFFANVSNGVTFSGITSATEWNFKTELIDSSPPIVTSLLPSHNSVINQLSANLEINFNEPVYFGTGTIEIWNVSTGSLFRSIPVTSDRITGSGSTKITIDPNRSIPGESNKPFVNNTQYYVLISNSAFIDSAGNHFAGIAVASTWKFTTAQTAVSHNANVSSILISDGKIDPVFSSTNYNYSVNVGSSVNSLNITPTLEDTLAVMHINGIPTTSGTPKTVPLSYGTNTITIEVTAEDGITKKTYTVTVNRAKPSNAGPSNSDPVNPVPVQPENPGPVKAIPNTVLPNPHGLSVATLTVNEDIKLYRLDEAGNLVEAKLAGKGSSLLVYDIYQGFYKLADNLYAIPSPTISTHIGKGEVRKDEVNVYDKDGRFLRTIKKGQEYKVYSYDDNRYAIGGGEFIEVQDGVTYVFGWITLTEPMTLYKADGTVERVLKAGEKYRIYSAHKEELHLGGGFTVQRENSMYTFVKN